MDALVNVLINVLLYISIPVAIRYAILRRPIESKWIAIGILVPIFIGFSILLNVQRDEFRKNLYQKLNIPYSQRPHMFGSPILYGAMIASYFILRRGRKKTGASNEEFYKSKDGRIKENEVISNKTNLEQDRYYRIAWEEIETKTIDKALWAKVFSGCSGDETLTKAKYIESRVRQLIEIEKNDEVAGAAKQQQSEAIERDRVIDTLRQYRYTVEEKELGAWVLYEPSGECKRFPSFAALTRYAHDVLSGAK